MLLTVCLCEHVFGAIDMRLMSFGREQAALPLVAPTATSHNGLKLFLSILTHSYFFFRAHFFKILFFKLIILKFVSSAIFKPVRKHIGPV